MPNLTHRLSLSALALAGAFLLLVAGIATLGPQRVDAQPRLSADDREIENIRFNVRFLNTFQPNNANARIKQIHVFPNEPVFLMETTENITVWERQNNALRLLTTITTRDNRDAFEEVIFLEDGRTFIVRTRRAAAIYSLDKIITYRDMNNRNGLRR